jgi:NADH:ubiquinone oxidoreductase 24 kD subunit
MESGGKAQRGGVHKIVVCMGSSCYLRGNLQNTQIISDYIEEEGIAAKVEFSGALCSGQCKEGPVITIDGETYTRVDSSGLLPLLRYRLSSPDA